MWQPSRPGSSILTSVEDFVGRAVHCGLLYFVRDVKDSAVCGLQRPDIGSVWVADKLLPASSHLPPEVLLGPRDRLQSPPPCLLPLHSHTH